MQFAMHKARTLLTDLYRAPEYLTNLLMLGWLREYMRYICVEVHLRYTLGAKRSDGPERRPLEGVRMRHQRPCRRPLRTSPTPRSSFSDRNTQT